MGKQALEYLVECMRHLARHSASNFFLTVAVAVALGGLCWFLATQYTKLWNLRYNATFNLHILCAISAMVTVVFTIAFVSLDYAKEIARAKLGDWHRLINSDRQFTETTYADAYNKVKSQGRERFDPARHFPPGRPNSSMPMARPETQIFVSKLTADAALAHFRRTNPFLSKVIMPGNADVPAPVITNDMKTFFATPNHGNYHMNRGVDIAASLFERNLELQTPKVVSRTRRWITMLFLLVQMIPFGLIGYYAYKDLKSTA